MARVSRMGACSQIFTFRAMAKRKRTQDVNPSSEKVCRSSLPLICRSNVSQRRHVSLEGDEGDDFNSDDGMQFGTDARDLSAGEQSDAEESGTDNDSEASEEGPTEERPPVVDVEGTGKRGTKPKKPPTGEELRNIKDAADLYQSSSFKLQVRRGSPEMLNCSQPRFRLTHSFPTFVRNTNASPHWTAFCCLSTHSSARSLPKLPNTPSSPQEAF